MNPPRILLGVSGGIAAYKAVEVLRELTQRGADVRVAMTRGAREFIAPLTFATLSRHEVSLIELTPVVDQTPTWWDEDRILGRSV